MNEIDLKRTEKALAMTMAHRELCQAYDLIDTACKALEAAKGKTAMVGLFKIDYGCAAFYERRAEGLANAQELAREQAAAIYQLTKELT